MKKILVFICLAAAVFLTTGTVMADRIKGRVGVTGKIGLPVPGDSDLGDNRIKTEVGFVVVVGFL